MKEGIVLVAHGSRDPQWARPFERIAAGLAHRLPAVSVSLAFLEHGVSLDEAVAALAAKGVASIRIVPLFLGEGGHVKEDLPRLVERCARAGLHLRLEAPIGQRSELIDVIVEIIAAAR